MTDIISDDIISIEIDFIHKFIFADDCNNNVEIDNRNGLHMAMHLWNLIVLLKQNNKIKRAIIWG